MQEVVNIGKYDNKYQLYEVSRKNINGNGVTKSTYIVANNDADKFEKYYQAQNEIQNSVRDYYTPEYKKRYSRKMKLGALLGAIVGAGIPLSAFVFTKNKYVRIVCAIGSAVGSVLGAWIWFSNATIKNYLPPELKQQYKDNFKELRKLDHKKIKEEKI